MSLHGRIYVEKNLILEKYRQKQLEAHYKSLSQIKEGASVLHNFKEVTRNTDNVIRNEHRIRK